MEGLNILVPSKVSDYAYLRDKINYYKWGSNKVPDIMDYTNDPLDVYYRSGVCSLPLLVISKSEDLLNIAFKKKEKTKNPIYKLKPNNMGSHNKAIYMIMKKDIKAVKKILHL